MSQIYVTAEGKDNIEYLIQGLDDFEKSKAVKRGLRAGAGVFVTIGKRNLRSRLKGTGRGSLIDSFAIKVKRYKPGVLAGFRRSGKWIKYVTAGNHAHLVDLGTDNRWTKKTYKGFNQYRGYMPANRFWSDAAVSGEQQAMNKVYEGVKRAVERLNERRNA